MPPYRAPAQRRDGTTMRSHSKTGEREGILARMARRLTSIAGITAAIATITTSAAAVLGVVVHTKTTQLQQAHALASSQAQQIHQQARQLRQLQQAPTPAATPSTVATPGTSAQVANVAHYLSNESPTVDSGNLNSGQEVISAKPYPNSIEFNCDGASGSGGPAEAFDVAGSSTFIAELGIPDNAEDVTGVVATVTFSNEAGQQIGQQVEVSLGHPVSIRLNITGVTQLGMTCNGVHQQTSQPDYDFDVALGNAGVS
jgi:hypothetical protein